MPPLVTIGLTTYRRPRMLAQAIQSILNQTVQDFEIVIADDNSGDDTEAVVASFRDPRLRYFRNATNLGQIRNTNRCIREAQGRYFCWNSDDNAYLPTFIETMAGALERHPEVGLAACGMYTCDIDFRPIVDLAVSDEVVVEAGPQALRTLFGTRPAYTAYTPSSVLLRREWLLQIGALNETFFDDYAWIGRFVYHFGCVRVPDLLFCYRVYGNDQQSHVLSDRHDPVEILSAQYEDVLRSVPSSDPATRRYCTGLLHEIARRGVLTVARNIARGRGAVAAAQIRRILALHPAVVVDPLFARTLAERWRTGRAERQKQQSARQAASRAPVLTL